jgi:hypothetical protein
MLSSGDMNIVSERRPRANHVTFTVLTSKCHRKPGEHLVDILMSVTNQKKPEIDGIEDPGENQPRSKSKVPPALSIPGVVGLNVEGLRPLLGVHQGNNNNRMLSNEHIMNT